MTDCLAHGSCCPSTSGADSSVVAAGGSPGSAGLVLSMGSPARTFTRPVIASVGACASMWRVQTDSLREASR